MAIEALERNKANINRLLLQKSCFIYVVIMIALNIESVIFRLYHLHTGISIYVLDLFLTACRDIRG